ncbi:MAG: hypothetical protein K8W52_13650 [Deltaproteobacteria bacterium]|nr:hypothetical protein [Deltaproteobacteria bacterium]
MRFGSGGLFTLFAVFFPLLALGLVGVAVALPSQATLTCDRTSKRCAIESASRISSSREEFALDQLQGAHVATTSSGATVLALDLTTGTRELGKSFHDPELGAQVAQNARVIAAFTAAHDGASLAVTAPIRHFDMGYWASAFMCGFFGVLCLAWRTRGTITASRDDGQLRWRSRGLLRSADQAWPLSEITGVDPQAGSFYSVGMALVLSGGRRVTVVRQWRSKGQQCAIDETATTLRVFLGLAR